MRERTFGATRPRRGLSPPSPPPAVSEPSPSLPAGARATLGPYPEVAGTLDRALALVRYLRAHCPWDARQTARSLVPYLLEETRETVEAIHSDDREALRGELGDLLLNLAFQVVVAEEEGHFDAEEITDGLERKMVRRHPHLFGVGEKEGWEAVKARERAEREAHIAREDGDPSPEGALGGLASGLDPLLAAYRMQERAAGVGFDWDHVRGALAKLREELNEVEEVLEGGDESARFDEVGDLLFAVVNVARLAGVHPLPALERANAKFRRRFEGVERLAQERSIPMPGAPLEELDRLWDEMKLLEVEPQEPPVEE